MNNSSKTKGCFELLPNEILLDLFENYIRLIDVYLGFYRLNHRRINAILNSAQFYIDIPSKDIYHSQSFAHFAQQIVSLHLSTFCNPLDVSTLVNLRFLHMERPTSLQLNSIKPDRLPHLYYLSLLPCWYSVSELPRHLENIHLSSSFPHLRFCVLPNGTTLRFPPKHNHSSTSAQ